jgi:hypothetical protein
MTACGAFAVNSIWEITMGKMKDMLIQMEEDAVWMPKESWVYQYGKDHIEIWEEAQRHKLMESVDGENQ